MLGRREVFESCLELKPAFDILLKRPDKLMLVTGELWPSQRIVADEEEVESVQGEAQMEGLEHLGQYVYEMSNSKLQQLRAQKGLPAADQSSTAMEIVQEDAEVAFDQDEGDAYEEEGGSDAEEIV